MANLIRRPQTTPAASSAVQPDEVLNAQVIEAERAGVTAVAWLQTGAYAASVGMHSACRLSQVADAAFRVSPLGEDSYRAILTAYGDFAVSEIQALSHRGRGR